MTIEQALISIIPNLAVMVVVPIVIKQLEKRSLTRNAVRALLRDRLVQAYNDYNEKGAMPIYARGNIEEMYAQYHQLGGNGVVEGLIKKLRELPVIK